MEVISKTDARIAGLTTFNTGLPCLYGHLALRHVTSGGCCECRRLSVIKNRALRPERTKELRAKHRRKNYCNNKQNILAKNKEWKDKNCARALELSKLYYLRNREKILQSSKRYFQEHQKKCNEWTRQWAIRHPAAKNASRRTYQATKLGATPKWVDVLAIRRIYEEALRRSRIDGIKYHVDHIIPLQGRLVCGLHVVANLQILAANVNISKGNRLCN